MADSFKESALIYHTDPTPGKLAILPTKPWPTNAISPWPTHRGRLRLQSLIEKGSDQAASVTARGNLVGV